MTDGDVTQQQGGSSAVNPALPDCEDEEDDSGEMLRCILANKDQEIQQRDQAEEVLSRSRLMTAAIIATYSAL